MQKNETIEILIMRDRLKYLDYILNSMCGRDLSPSGREFIEKEKTRILNKLNHELSVIKDSAGND